MDDSDWKFLFISLKGRIPRGAWWFGVIGLTVTACLLLFAIAFLGDLLEVSHGVLALTLVLIMLAIVIAWLIGLLALCVKRLQDHDRSGWWLAPVCVVCLAWLAAMQYGLFRADGRLTTMGMALAVLLLGVALLCLVELGFLRGTRGENRFGPDPVGTAPAEE